MKEVLIINGSGGVGKDTFVAMLKHHLGGGVIHESIVNNVKDIAKKAGWAGGKSEKDRKFLAELKDLIDQYNDANYERIRILVERFKKDEVKGKLLCIDMREKEQIERAKKDFGAKVVFIERDAVAPIKSNHADAEVANAPRDYTVKNNGTLKDLFDESKKFLARYLKDIIDEKNAAKKKKESSKLNPFRFKKLIYISHPYKGKKENYDAISRIIKELVTKYPDYLFLSPVHAFGSEYEYTDYYAGLEKCLYLLEMCDEMWVYGDYKTSTGCMNEIWYCMANDIPYKTFWQEEGEIEID